jgi:hypothetical protein
MKELQKKVINRLICSKSWEMLITSMELEKAAQWYGELFAMTTEVEPAYYYRYAISSFH